jgi:lipid-A-disaccharide synthase
MVIVYRMSPLSYHLLRRLVKIETIGMVNLIAGERLVPELVQNAFTPDAVAREAVSMLTDPVRAAHIAPVWPMYGHGLAAQARADGLRQRSCA